MNFNIIVKIYESQCHLTIDNENNLIVFNSIYQIHLRLSLDLKITWKIKEDFIIGFEIDQYVFTGNHKELSMLKCILGGQVTFKKINNMYNFVRIIGNGNYSQVCLLQCKLTGKEYAVKCMKTDNQDAIFDIYREISIQKQLHHKNIAKIHEIYESSNNIYVVMEKLNHLRNDYDHEEIKLIMKSILEAVEYIHSQNILHRDLKIDNILIDDENQIKIIDFGLACQLINLQPKYITCGTPGYVAPEILQYKPYDFKCDIFSLGVVMYQLCFNKHLFHSDDVTELLKMNKKFTLSRLSVLNIPDSGYAFLRGLLNHNPTQRFTAKQALNHWYLNSLTDYHCPKIPRSFKPKFKAQLKTYSFQGLSKTTIASPTNNF